MMGVISIVAGILLSLLANHWLLVPAKQIDMDQLSGRVVGIEHKIDKAAEMIQELVVAKRIDEAVKQAGVAGVPPAPARKAAARVGPAVPKPWVLFGR